MQKLSDVFVTHLDAHKVTELVVSSVSTGHPVDIRGDNESKTIAAVFFGEEKDVAIGRTTDGDFIAISLGDKAKRRARKGTVAIVTP